jgi:hypothetical protein
MMALNASACWLWVNGVLHLDEDVFDPQATMVRALELRRLVAA